MVTIDDIKILHEFLSKKGIDFVLTGTMGLYLHGLLPEGYEPGDIDIIIVSDKTTKDIVYSVLKDIEYITGGQNVNKEDYMSEVFTFFVGSNRTKVNAILYHIDESLPFGNYLTTGPIPTHVELIFGKSTLKLHAVDEILKAKFKLHRPKDYKFYHQLIKTISSYV